MERGLRTVWCGNLSNRVTEDLLYELFLQAGPVEEVKIPKDRDARPRRYGFVTFKHDVSVDYALQLFKGTFLYNREMCVDRTVRQSQDHSNNHNNQEIPAPNGNCKPSMPPGVTSNGQSLNPVMAYPLNMYPNPYGSHTQLGYRGPSNMYPSKDRRNSSRSQPYSRN